MTAPFTNFGLQELLDYVAGTILYELHLFVNNITPDQDSVEGDFTEPSFDTYAPVLLLWDPSTVAAPGDVNAASNFCLFGPEGDSSTTLVYGWFVLDNTGGLVAAGQFSGAPITVDDAAPALVVQGSFDVQNP
jgi:hypothetical protein